MRRYRKGYELEKMVADRINATGEWLCQRGPSSKGIDVLACSKKHLRTVFLECKNTDADEFRVERVQIEDLVRKGFVGGAEVYVVIHWRGREDEEDKRRKLLCFYPFDVLAQKLDSTETKTISFRPYEHSMRFEDVFT